MRTLGVGGGVPRLVAIAKLAKHFVELPGWRQLGQADGPAGVLLRLLVDRVLQVRGELPAQACVAGAVEQRGGEELQHPPALQRHF